MTTKKSTKNQLIVTKIEPADELIVQDFKGQLEEADKRRQALQDLSSRVNQVADKTKAEKKPNLTPEERQAKNASAKAEDRLYEVEREEAKRLEKTLTPDLY